MVDLLLLNACPNTLPLSDISCLTGFSPPSIRLQSAAEDYEETMSLCPFKDAPHRREPQGKAKNELVKHSCVQERARKIPGFVTWRLNTSFFFFFFLIGGDIPCIALSLVGILRRLLERHLPPG